MLEAINNSETYKTNEEQMLLDKKSKDLSDLSEFIHGSMLTTEEILDGGAEGGDPETQLKKQKTTVITPYWGALTNVERSKLLKDSKSTHVRVGMFMKQGLSNGDKTSIEGRGLRQIDGTGNGFGAGSIQLNQKVGKNTQISIGDMPTPTTYYHNPFPLSTDGELISKTQDLTPIGSIGSKITYTNGPVTISGGSFMRDSQGEHHASGEYALGKSKLATSVWMKGNELSGAVRFENPTILTDIVSTKGKIGVDIFINLKDNYRLFVDGVYDTKDSKNSSLELGAQKKMEVKYFDGIVRATIDPLTKQVGFKLLINTNSK